MWRKLSFVLITPPSLSGTKINSPSSSALLDNCEYILPNDFPASQFSPRCLPVLPKPRRALLYDAIDLHHSHICKTTAFHIHVDEDSCICRFCNEPCLRYHYQQCRELATLSPSSRMKKAFVAQKAWLLFFFFVQISKDKNPNYSILLAPPESDDVIGTADYRVFRLTVD